MKTLTLKGKKLDAEINRIYMQNCSNIPIDIMDISKVFEVGKKAYEEGKDMKEAIVSFVNSIRKDGS
jgi:hypothetical protein